MRKSRFSEEQIVAALQPVTARISSGHGPRPAASPWASPFFCEHLLQDLHVEGLVGDDLLQSPVFVLELLGVLLLAEADPAILRLPAVEGRPRHAQLAADLADVPTRLEPAAHLQLVGLLARNDALREP